MKIKVRKTKFSNLWMSKELKKISILFKKISLVIPKARHLLCKTRNNQQILSCYETRVNLLLGYIGTEKN